MVKQCRGKNLFFSTSVKRAMYGADIVFASPNTPTKFTDVGARRAADLRYIACAGRTVAEYEQIKIITEESTVPAKTAKDLKRVVNSDTGCHSCWILSNPEFLTEGTALKDRSNPDRVLIGGPTTH